MNNTLRNFLTLVSILLSNLLLAQNTGTSSGKIVDKETRAPLEFVNVAFFSEKTLVGGGITNATGHFRVEKLPLNKPIFARISSIGYTEIRTAEITITTKDPIKKMADIELSSSAISLNSVEIKGQKRMIEYALDKKIVNVEQSLVSEGGTASDVLQNVPSVTVDEDGKVSLKGSENVTILIDGRPAVLSGLGLDQISANTIESIEIISNPSAKYNPEGMAGILNIKTKKRSNSDFNGMVNFSAATSNQYSGSANLNFGLGKVTLFTSLDLSFRERLSEGSTSTRSTRSNALYPDDNMEWEVGRNKSKRKGFGGQLRLGADWRITDKDLFSASVNGGMWYNNRTNESPYTLTTSYLDPSLDGAYNPEKEDANPYDYHFMEAISNSSNSRSNFNQVNATLSYKHDFAKKGQELTIDASLDYSLPISTTNTVRTIEDYFSPFVTNLQESKSTGNGFDFDGQINYAHPIGKYYKLEVGYQAKLRANTSSDRQNLRVYSFQDTAIDFTYTEQNHGIYANFGGTIKNFSFQIGGRMEFAAMNAGTVSELRDTTFQYFQPRFYPSVHFSYKIGKMQEIQLSYTRRVNRPSPWNLNPFIDYGNYPSSISMGNPALKPEDIHSLELNYSISFKGTSFYVTAFYRRVEDVIRRYTFEREDGVRVQTFLNYASGTNYGFDLSYEQRLFSWWRMSLSGSLYQNITVGDGLDASLNSEGLSYQFRFNTSFSLPLDISLQFSCRYRGPNYYGQTLMEPNFSAEIAARKGFLKNRLSLGLRISDIFHTMGSTRTTTGSNFVTVSKRSPLRSTAAFITLSYKINQGLKKGQQRQNAQSSDSGSASEEM